MNDTNYIIGIDEVGRGPLAGPVTVCAFCISCEYEEEVFKALGGITDSKKLSSQRREKYYEKITILEKQKYVQYAISHISAQVIDMKGITWSLETAIKRSLKKLNLPLKKCFIFLDGGLAAPDIYVQETVIKGDQKIWHIGAASVVAKVLRDRKMVKYSQKFPEYGFDKHKGYGTALHKEAIKKYGVLPIHRSTWIQ
ncbi:ribonuclease HII [Candidatus Campbellbacteria bacterium]|nr:ribonuclease HII [Candidatus Campbellbacteria bacterium]|tara:strand:- start:2525 stop:3115 length:591 start_codon:yes stop_codon:yes gene_type:complete